MNLQRLGLRTAGALALCWPGMAHGAAWMMPDQLIVGAMAKEQGDDLQGEVGYYYERGISPTIGVASRGFVSSKSDFAAPGRRTWAGQTALTGKLRLLSGPHTAAAVELGPVYTFDKDRDCRGLGGTLRGLAGASLGPAFVNLEAAYVARTPECIHAQYQIDTGVQLGERWQAIGNVFTNRNYNGGYSANAQLSLLRRARSGDALQLGVRWRLDRVAGENPGIVIGWWAAPRSAR